mmetsp:Transcript_8262/g.18813  ORF Transcript_8262/g.18813 Transcript_8262/m.18813 type:complete len:122 (-) Transcript_8262:608-973(-)
MDPRPVEIAVVDPCDDSEGTRVEILSLLPSRDRNAAEAPPALAGDESLDSLPKEPLESTRIMRRTGPLRRKESTAVPTSLNASSVKELLLFNPLIVTLGLQQVLEDGLLWSRWGSRLARMW